MGNDMKPGAHTRLWFLIILVLGAASLVLSCSDSPTDPQHTNPLDDQNPDTDGDPFALTASVDGNRIVLNWSVPTGPAIGSLAIRRRTIPESAFTSRVDGLAPTTTTWSDTDVTAGGRYEYQVLAFDEDGRASQASQPTPEVTIQEAISVAVEPTTATVHIGETRQFSATVSGTADKRVTWSVSEGEGSISNTGLYTAPASVPSPATATVKATSVADPTKSATAVVTIQQAVAVAVTPLTATVTVGQQQQFSATVTGTANTSVTWSVVEGDSWGSVSGTGLYTAPASVPSPATATVKATSVADPTKSATAVVTILPAVAGSLEVTGVFQFGSNHIGITFSDAVVPNSVWSLTNYTLQPSHDLIAVTVQENGRTVVLRTSSDLESSTDYSLTLTGILGRTAGNLSSPGPYSFSTVSERVTNIAFVQNNVSILEGTSITVIGQVFIVDDNSSSNTSAYIQDGSGRGINVFGSVIAPALKDRGNIVRVTGIVEPFFTTTELVDFSAQVVVSNQPHLAPRVLTVQEAQSSDWEGTYIQTTATLIADPAASGSDHYNYVGDGISFRVRNTTWIDPAEIFSGDTVTGAGAGSRFGMTFQIYVGHPDDFSVESGPLRPERSAGN